MRIFLSIVSAVATLVLMSAPAQAFAFGATEELHTIADVGVVGEKNEALALGYKTTTQNFLLPYTISDDGYVLISKTESNTYYPIAGRQLIEWQAAGLLPDPLPTYEISMLDRLIGHALWPTLVVIGLVYLIQTLRRRRTATATPSDQTPAQPGG